MSSIRLFLLGSLEERGPMHGHQLRLLAEEEHIHLWTDFTVGGVYGALKRLTHEGLVTALRTERAGNRPERQVLEISDAGRAALAEMRLETIRRFVLKPDPFDLAITRLGPDALTRLPELLGERRAAVQGALTDAVAALERVAEHLTVAETHVMHHHRFRLQAELDWLDSVIADLPAIDHDEQTREVA